MKTVKLNLIATICLGIGLAIFITGFIMMGGDITKVSTNTPLIEKNYVSTKAISSILVDDSNADIVVSASTDDKVHLTYDENNLRAYVVNESDSGELTIAVKNVGKWYNYIMNIQIDKPKLLLQMPSELKNDLTLQTGDGKITVNGIKAKNVTLESFSRDILVKDVNVSGDCNVKNSDGEIKLVDLKAAGEIVCNTFSDKIELNNVEGKSINVKNSDGRIVLKSVSSKQDIYAKTFSGNVELQNLNFGKDYVCEVSDGNVTGSIDGKLSDYTVVSKTSDGENNLPENMSGGNKNINIKTFSGNINIAFESK